MPFLRFSCRSELSNEPTFRWFSKRIIRKKKGELPFLFRLNKKWRTVMFQKIENGFVKKLFVLFIAFAVSLAAGLCFLEKSVASAEETEFYVNAVGSNLSYAREADGGINVTMQASDDYTGSSDKLIYNKTFSVTEEITAYLKPSEVQNAAAQYIVMGLASENADTGVLSTAYEIHIAATSSDGKYNIRTTGSVWGAYERPIGGVANVSFNIVEGKGLIVSYNGTTLEEWSGVTAQSFPNGIRCYFRAFAVTWWGGTPDKLPTYIRVGDPKAVDTEKIYYTSLEEDIVYAMDMNGATATGVELNGKTLAADEYTVTENALTLTAAGIKNHVPGNGDYIVTVKNPAKDISFALRVSGTENLEIANTDCKYDLHKDGDFTLPVWKNKDTFVKLLNDKGAEVSASYNETAQVLTIPKAYMQTLQTGSYTFTIVSTGNGDGANFTITVENTAPPCYTDEQLVFDRFQPDELVFNVETYQNGNVWLEGDITENDYIVVGEQITIKSAYLQTLAPETYHYFLCGANGQTELIVTVKDTKPATLVSENIVRINLNSVTDAKFTFAIYYDEILSVTGNSITVNDWQFDKTTSTLIIRKSFFETLGVTGDYSFTVTTKNGANITLTVQVASYVAPVLLSDATAVFEKDEAEDITFMIRLNESLLTSVVGNGITADDYAVQTQNDELTITLNSEYLSGLADGEYSFAFGFTNGEIVVTITVENALNATFEKGYTALYIMAGKDDIRLNVNANYGVFLGVTGDILKSDYSYDKETQTLAISKTYLAALDGNKELTVVFDNGGLTLYLETAFAANIFDVYEPLYINNDENSVRVTAEEEYWTKVEYLKPTYGAYGGGVKFLTTFSAKNVIELYVDFEYVPDILGTGFALTLSDGGYMMHYGDWPSELFATFSVGEKFLQSAYFGIPNIHTATNEQVAHELLKRSAKGYETFTFDIGETSTKIYFNGVLIRELTEVTRSNFTGNDVYVMFTPLFWHEEEGTTFRIKSNAATQVFDSFYIVNTEILSPVLITAEIEGIFGGVSLVCGDEELPINSFEYSRNTLTGAVHIQIPAAALLLRNGFDASKEYKICIKSSAGDVFVPLKVSNAKHFEFLQSENVFDKKKSEDLKINYALNLDTINGLEGNGITAEDYTVENDVITLKADFLSAFAIGELTFTVYSSEMPQGQTFTVRVVDSTASAIGQADGSFDLNAEKDIAYALTLTVGHTLTVSGNAITAEDYTVADGKIVLSKTYMQTLGVGEYTFIVYDYYTENLYNVTEIVLKVVNSLSPEFTDGTKETVVTYTLGSNANVSVRVCVNKGVFVEAVGGYITADLYRYDAETATVTFYKEWFDMMDEDDFKVRISFDNGDIYVRFIVESPAVETVTQPQGGCSSLVNAYNMTAVLTIVAACVFIKRKTCKKGE